MELNCVVRQHARRMRAFSRMRCYVNTRILMLGYANAHVSGTVPRQWHYSLIEYYGVFFINAHATVIWLCRTLKWTYQSTRVPSFDMTWGIVDTYRVWLWIGISAVSDLHHVPLFHDVNINNAQGYISYMLPIWWQKRLRTNISSWSSK